MKNIHLIPTDKPSRLIKNNLGLAINEDFTQSILDLIQAKFVNIYITSDEEIKEGDWSFDIRGFIEKVDETYDLEVINALGKKIILTTDQDLIKDGVQSIPNEFLEWFVKNPSCEKVEIEKVLVTNSGLGYQEYAILDSNFKVIEINTKIPQKSYRLGKVTILDSYEYVVNYKIIIPKEESN